MILCRILQYLTQMVSQDVSAIWRKTVTKRSLNLYQDKMNLKLKRTPYPEGMPRYHIFNLLHIFQNSPQLSILF